jgi:hypothetical protein
MTAEDFDRDVENVGRLPGKIGVQGSTGLLLATISLTGNCRESNIFMQASSMRSGDIFTKQERLTFVLKAYATQLCHFLVVSPKSVRVRKTQIQKAA